MIKSIFEIGLGTAEFTHVPGHSVSGITLPPDDATSFHYISGLSRAVKKIGLIFGNHVWYILCRATSMVQY